MIPDDQPTVPTRPPDPSRSSAPGVWVAPSVEELQAKLPQYEVLEILGRGGMGAVYKARQKSLKRLVAIKILPLGMADDEFKFVERFQNEAQTMAQMNHPAIVAVHDFGETSDGLLYFVMEFVDGTDVHKMIQASGRLSGEYALAITAHVCDALSYAHKRGVIHRDIKPANILIDQEGRIKVADFGLAKMNDPAQTSGLTKTNMAMGTPDYVAPEVLSPGMVADHRADLYAVGVMLYQMLTGEVPRGMFKLPSQKGIGSDPRFDEIICKAMEQDREERYQSAAEVRQALDVILTTPQPKDDGTGVVSAQKLVAKQLRPPGEMSHPLAQKPDSPKAKAPSQKSSLATTWLSIGGGVAVLAAAGILILGGKPKPQPSAPADTSAVTPAAKPTVAAPSAQGKVIDLLALVDVKRDAVAGEWSRTSEGLAKTGGTGSADSGPRLQLPCQPAAEYDFEIEFTTTGGRGNVGQLLAAQGREFVWMLNTGNQGNHRAGFGMLDNQSTTAATETTAPLKEGIVDGRRHRSRVEVRAGRLRGFLDDVEIVSWTGNFSRLSLDAKSKLRAPGHIGLRLDRDAVFHKITVREVSGTGKVEAALANDSPPVIATWRDVTESVSEKAKSAAGLVVTDKGIEKQGDGADPRLLITPPGQRDQAIRLRYTGYSQVDLHFNDSGFLYVMAQPNQTIFQSQARGTSALPVKLIPNKLHPPGFEPQQPHELLVTIEGTRLRAWVDGRFVGEAKADAYTEGATGLTITPATIVHQVELGELAGAAPSGPPNLKWQDVTAKFREKAADLPGVQINEDAVRLAEGAATQRVFITPPGVRDFAVRVRYTGGVQIDRMNEESAFDFLLCQRNPPRVAFQRHMPGSGVTEDIGPKTPFPAGYDETQQHQLVAIIEGPRMRVWVDDRFMGEANDDRITSGAGAIALKSYTPIYQVETAELAVTTIAGGISPAAPANANWKDVTETVGEELRAKAGFTVGREGISRSSEGEIVYTPLLDGGVGDRAVRVRYIGQTQISLWFAGGGGSAFVLAQRDRVMFKRQRQKDGEADTLRPSVTHPAGFDATQPHELLVVVQGATVRTWLDGRFVSEAEEAPFQQSALTLVPMKESIVQKVEVAELEAAR